MSYECPDAPSHKAIVGLCKNNLNAKVCSLIVGLCTKTMAQLIEASTEAEGFLIELKKGSSPLPTVAVRKDAATKTKKQKESFQHHSRQERGSELINLYQ